MRNRLAVAALALCLPAVAAAQSAAPVAMPKNVISIQPLSAMFTVLAAEYERAAGKSLTWGLGITNWSVGDDNIDEVTYSSGDVKLRYYPQGTALQGFSFGGSLGFAQITGEDNTTTPPTEEKVSGGTLGILIEYQWLLGARKKFAIALGVGAKMVAVDEDEISSGSFIARYPTARVGVGYAF